MRKPSQLIHRLVINTAALSAYQIGRIGFNMLLSILVARLLGVEGLGKYAIMTAYVQIFQQVSNAGVTRLVVRESARQTSHRNTWFQHMFINQVLGATAGAVLLVLIAYRFVSSVDTINALEIAAASLFPFALSSSAEAQFQAREKMEWIAIPQTLGRAFQVVGSIVVLYLGHGIVALAWMLFAGQTLTALLQLFLTVRMNLWQHFRFELFQALRLFKKARDFFLLSISAIIFAKLDILILSQLTDESSVGIYNAAFLVIQVVNLLSVSYSNAVYPIFSRLTHNSQTRFQELLRRSLVLGTAITTAAAIVLVFAADWIILTIFSAQEYSSSVLLLRILSPFVIIFICNSLMAHGLMASNLQRRTVIVSLVKLIVGVILYWFLIQGFGLIGAAIATVLTGLTGTLMNYYFITKDVFPRAKTEAIY